MLALMPAAKDSDDTRGLLKKIAVHGLVLGQILAAQEYLHEGLALIEQCTNVLLSVCNDPDAYVSGRCISAKLLGERRRLREALEILRAARAVAATLDNEETLAHLLNNIGGLEYSLFGNATEAKKCLEEALGIFEDLGKKAHALRPRTALAAILMAEGTRVAISRCISELFKCRAWPRTARFRELCGRLRCAPRAEAPPDSARKKKQGCGAPRKICGLKVLP